MKLRSACFSSGLRPQEIFGQCSKAAKSYRQVVQFAISCSSHAYHPRFPVVLILANTSSRYISVHTSGGKYYLKGGVGCPTIYKAICGLQHIYSYILILSFSRVARKQSLGPLSIYRARPAPLPIRDSVDDPQGSPTEALEAPAFDAYATSALCLLPQ